jgi:hypothetical protein
MKRDALSATFTDSWQAGQAANEAGKKRADFFH